MVTQTISVFTCFDNNYVIPAAVAFLSLAERADPAHRYQIHVAHSDITQANQDRLRAMLGKLNVSLELSFIDICNTSQRINDLFALTWNKAHYSKEMFYKLIISSLFPQHDKMLVTDVDVVFLGDVSRDYLAYDAADDWYWASSRCLIRRGCWVERELEEAYSKKYTPEERKAILYFGGYYIANLKQMRENDIEAQLLRFAEENAYRLIQPEQDVLNLVCHPHARQLPADSMVCTYAYGLYQTEADFSEDPLFTADEVHHALDHPIQLHYAGHVKPWTDPSSTRSDAWFEVLARTGFLTEQLERMGWNPRPPAPLAPVPVEPIHRTLASIKVPFTRRKLIVSSGWY